MSHATRERGFSLVEMLAALIIFALGVMAVLEVVTASVRSTTATVGYTEAVFLAQQRIEETIATEALAPMTDSGDFGEAYPRHAWKREVEEVDARPALSHPSGCCLERARQRPAVHVDNPGGEPAMNGS